jgi:GT2 family glycosyltransferase
VSFGSPAGPDVLRPATPAAVRSRRMSLSVIVPTHDRPAVLHDLLETLQAQAVDPARLEVIVIDDGSPSDMSAVVSAAADGGAIEMRCEPQAMTGLNGARNRGVALARGDVIAFLDDDTLVSPGWAAALLAAFEDDACAAVGGRIELGFASPEPPWLTEWRCYLAEYDLGTEARWLTADDPVPVGANCAVRRADFERAGGFRPGLDRIGRSLVSNGDTEFFRRLRAAGGRLRYVPEASVIHRIPPGRMTVQYFLRRHRAQGVSDELLLRLEGHRASWGHRVGLAGEVATTARSLALARLRGRDTVRDRLLLSYWTGRLAATRLNPDAAGGEPERRRPGS